MELKLLISIATSLLGSLFGQMLSDHEQAPPLASSVQPQVVEHRLSVPSFVTEIPSGHFAGVSVPCNNLAEARNSAIFDAIRQILSAVNVSYSHHYLDQVSGNVRRPERVIDDRFSKVANGIVLGAEKCIVKSSWSKDAAGRYVYFILVRYPDKLISEMRRLSKGAKVIGRVIRSSDGEVELRLSEVNGVAVTLSSVDINIMKVNKFAPFISYYIVKVRKSSKSSYSRAINPFSLCGESRNIKLKLKPSEKQMFDYVLGAEIDAVAVLKGHDEIGRVVTSKIDI
jgi:hypothetical protein